MNKAVTLVLENEELIELMRILMDDDADGALVFLNSSLDKSNTPDFRSG